MKATLIIRPPRAISAVRAVRPSVRMALLAQIGICVVPGMVLLALRQPLWGGRCFFSVLLLMLFYHFLRGQPLQFTAILLAVMPAMMFFRDFLFYSSVQVLLLACVLLWLLVAQHAVEELFTNPATRTLLLLAAIYWAASFAVTGNYASNYRTFELALAACAVFLLGKYRSYLITAFLGVSLTVCGLGAGMLPSSTRLGMAEFGRMRLGNPIQVGIPCAFIFLLTIVDGGALLGLRKRPVLRLSLRMIASVWLLLSTSRGAWLIALTGLLVLFLFDRSQRKVILLSVAMLVAVTGILVVFTHSDILLSYVEKTFSPETSWNKRTTGRADQWLAIPRVISESPVWGFGPGTGRDIASHYAGRNILWHALYLQLVAETGLLGVFLCLGCLVALVVRALRHRSRTGETAPLLGVLSFLAIGLSVPGIDGNSAMFLGLGLLAGDYSRMWILRSVSACTLTCSPDQGQARPGSGPQKEQPAVPTHLPPSALNAGYPLRSGPGTRTGVLLASPSAGD